MTQLRKDAIPRIQTQEEIDAANSPERMAWRKGFLAGQYDDYPKTEDELDGTNPYVKGTAEHAAYTEGYYSNLC